MLNNAVLIGRLTREPELRYLPNIIVVLDEHNVFYVKEEGR